MFKAIFRLGEAKKSELLGRIMTGPKVATMKDWGK